MKKCQNNLKAPVNKKINLTVQANCLTNMYDHRAVEIAHFHSSINSFLKCVHVFL